MPPTKDRNAFFAAPFLLLALDVCVNQHLCFNLGQNLDFEQLEDSNRVPCSIFRWEQNRAAVLVQFSCKALKQDHLCDILFCKYSVIFLFCKNSVTFFFCKYSVIFVFCKYSVTFIFFFLSSLNFEFVCSPISPL